MTQEDEIESLQKELVLNPKSPQFVRLAEMYISRQLIDEAEVLVRQSLKFHPRSISGLILIGRILKTKKKLKEALQPLSDAARMAPENWRAWFELAETYLELKSGKQALTAFKKVLFFNPNHNLARRAVAKLELLSADEYGDDVFQMQKLPEVAGTSGQEEAVDTEAKSWQRPNEQLIRSLSYIDALIVRHDVKKALELLNQCSEQFGQHPEIESRRLKLSVFENPDYIKPKLPPDASKARQKMIHDRKVSALKLLLRRIESSKSETLTT